MLQRITISVLLLAYLVINIATISVIKEEAKNRKNLLYRIAVFIVVNLTILVLGKWIITGTI